VRQPTFALSLLLSLCLPVAGFAENGRPIVKAIRVEGNRRVEVDAIKAAISQKTGAPYDRQKVNADVRALMKLGFFSDVVVQMEGSAQAPVLVYKVKEKPAVRETRLEGNDHLSKDDFKDIIDIKPYSVLDIAAVRRIVKKMQEKYVEKSYYLAEVSYRIENEPENQVVVVFAVNENAKVQVKRIEFVGNAHVSKDDLTSVMQTQEGGYLSFLTGSGTYREEAIQRDAEAVAAVYRDRGYMNVRVSKPAVSLSSDKRFIFIFIRVEEGEQFRIGKIDFSGELLGEEKAVAKLVQSKPGEIVVYSQVGRDLFAIADLYRDKGYAYANVSPVTNSDAKKRIIDVTFDVQPGEKARFERIEIEGNVTTRDKVIRRELRINEGELFSGTGLRVSKQRVTALGYFETVEISTRKGSADDLIVATVEVKEKPTGTFQVSAGYSSYEGFVLTGQISKNNLFGWGQTLSLEVQWSTIQQLGRIQFIEPYFFDTKWTSSFDLYASEGTYPRFTRRAVGGSMSWGYELSGLADVIHWTEKLDDVRLFATYTNEFVRVRPFDVENQLYNQYRSGTTSSLRLSLQWDKRDNRLFPTSGFYQSISAEIAPPVLAPKALFGNQVNLFTRYMLDSRFYKPLPFGFYGRVKLNLGYIRDWDSNHPVPISELFYVGGMNSVRGYHQMSISPTQLAGRNRVGDSALVSTDVGGDKELILNLELEFPMAEKLGLRGVLFADFGNSFAPGRFSDPNVSLSLYKSVGFGFRWYSPIGPLRFEWGIPLNRRRDPLTGGYVDQPIDFQFTIGSSF
jgi:outer membrane protein insertion porin family